MKSFMPVFISLVLVSVTIAGYTTPKVTANPATKSKISINKLPMYRKVLDQVVNEAAKIYGDNQGNAIVFARAYSNNHQPTGIKKGEVKNVAGRRDLSYSVYDVSIKQWSKQRVIHNPNFVKMTSITNYYFFNNSFQRSQILFYTSATKKVSLMNHGALKVDTILWSVRKYGLLGKWGKSRKVTTITGQSLSSLTKSCNISACVIAWRNKVNAINGSDPKKMNAIHFRFLGIGKGSDSRWSGTEQVSFPLGHKLLQHKMVLMDSSNLALIWLAAVKSNNRKIKLKVFARMRFNNQWSAVTLVATLGDKGVVKKFSELTVKSSSLRKILIIWSEYLATAEFKSILYDKKWYPATTIYKDNPEVTNIFPVITNSGKITLFWQQKYGKNTHIFSSNFAQTTNKWGIPLKLDKGPQVAILNTMRERGSDVVLMWLKNFKLMKFLFLNGKSDQGKEVRHQQNLKKGMSFPSVALFGNKISKVSWLKAVKTGFEVWVQDVNFKQDQGRH